MLYRVEGIVIRSMDYGEGNKIVVLLSREAGKISVMARGAKKIKSRHTAAAQMFTHGEYIFYKGASSQMGTLNHGEILASHHALREHLRSSAYAAYIAEMTDRLVADHEGGHLFEQLAGALDAMEEGKDPQIIAHVFEMLMLKEAGYAPSFDACASCGGEIAEPAFSVSGGGVLCSRCKPSAKDARLLDARTFRLLRAIRHADLRKLGRISVSAESKQQIKEIMRQYLDYHTGINWKSRHVIDQMEKYQL